MTQRTSTARKIALAGAGLLALAGVMRLLRRRQAAPHPASIYASGPTRGFAAPLKLEIDPMQRLFLYNFSGSAEYEGVEIQLFDDPAKGKGLAALLWRKDGLVDFYMTPGLTLDPDVGVVPVGEWRTADIDYTFAITPQGLQTEVAFTLKDGQPLRLVVHEQRRRLTPLSILAPMGMSITQPRFLPLFWLTAIDLVQVPSTEIGLTIGTETYLPDKIPMPVPHSRTFVYFVRYCADPLISFINRETSGPLPVAAPDHTDGYPYAGLRYDLALNGDHAEIRRAYLAGDGHTLAQNFDPPLPALLDLADGASAGGRYTVDVDGAITVLDGVYSVRRLGSQVYLRLQPTENWQPVGTLPQRLTIWLFPAVFRTWPTTYSYTATLDLDALTQASHWVRTAASTDLDIGSAT